MKNTKKETSKEQQYYNKSQIFVKIVAGILATLMVAGTGVTLVYALMR